MGFHLIGQVGLKLLTSGDPLPRTPKVPGIAGMMSVMVHNLPKNADPRQKTESSPGLPRIVLHQQTDWWSLCPEVEKSSKRWRAHEE
ncbi:hypothetical protein AAY473_006268 [Plecturocebus cupreus]